MIPRMLNAERCSVFIHDPVNRKIWLKAGTALQERGIEVSVKDSIVGEVISSGKPFFPAAWLNQLWRDCHAQLVAGHSNRTLLVAADSGHLIPLEEPSIVIDAAVQIARR